MKYRSVRVLAFCLLVSPLALQAQTWVGGFGGNVYNNGSNWTSPSGIPGAGADLTFGATSFPQVGFPGGFAPNSLTFTAAAPIYTLNGNGGTLSIGAGGFTTTVGGGGVNISNGLPIALSANQTWTIDSGANVTTSGNVSESGGARTLTKAGSGYLVLSGINSFTGGLAVNAGAVYLGSSNGGMTGGISVGATGTLGTAFSDITLANNITLASGATLGGSPTGQSTMELSGSVSIATGTSTLNLGAKSDIFISGTLSAGASTDLTVAGDGTGVAILANSTSNFTSITASNAAVAFGTASTLPAVIHATNGGYVSVGDVGGATPTVTAFLDKITNESGFSGIIGFDTDEEAPNPTVYDEAINLLSRGFTDGNVRLGSITSATLGVNAVITPVGQSYDFGGFAAQDGVLFVKSDLVQRNATTTTVSVQSSIASGGAPQNGMLLVLQGTGNTFSGNINASYGSVIVDSAISGTTNLNLGAYSYGGFTEGAGLTFSQFAARVVAGGYTATSILGIDSEDIIDQYVDNGGFSGFHTVNGVDLSVFTNPIYLGTMTGATITGTILAPGDGVLRVMSNSEDSPFTIQSAITSGNGFTNGLVVGMDGSEGAVVFGVNNSFGGNTTLAGGKLYLGGGTSSALSAGSLTVTAPSAGDKPVLAADSGTASLANNITVTGTTLTLGTGGEDESNNFTVGTTNLNLSGVISGTGGLYITGPTALSGANTYQGGTYVRANTSVSHNTGLGTGYVFLGGGSTLTFSTSAPSIGFLSDASTFNFNGGSGTINLTGTSPTLTINQTFSAGFGTFSGDFTGNAVTLVKNGTAQLNLTGNNAGQIAGATINAGNLAIGDAVGTGATFSGNVTLAGGNLFFRPGNGQSMGYSDSITGTSGSVTINGHSGSTVYVTGGSSSFTGSTSVNLGTLHLAGDNFWSSASATNVNTGATLRVDGDQTIKNLTGNGTINIFSGGKTFTVDSASGTSYTGAIMGGGNLAKNGSAVFTISGSNTYTGNTLVNAGTLQVNSSIASSPILSVSSGAFLQGVGQLNDVLMDGTYRPGLTGTGALVIIDNFSMSSTGLIHMELGGTGRGSQYDALDIANVFAVDGSLSVTFMNSFNPTLGNSFNLFDFASMTGTFDTINLAGLSGGLAWDTSLLYSDGIISVTAVPEPSTYAALAGLAALGFAAWRRRSARAVQVTTRL